MVEDGGGALLPITEITEEVIAVDELEIPCCPTMPVEMSVMVWVGLLIVPVDVPRGTCDANGVGAESKDFVTSVVAEEFEMLFEGTVITFVLDCGDCDN